MRLTRILRTIGFRLAALYAGLFALSALFLFGMIYWITGDALRQEVINSIEVEIAALVEEHRQGGLGETMTELSKRIGSDLYSQTSYLLLDPEGRKVAGDLDVRSRKNGWQELPIAPPPGSPVADEDDEHILLAFGLTFPDRSYLLVGQDTNRIDEVEEAIIQAFGWAFALTILLGALGGGALSVGFLHRVDAINRTTRAIIEGKLTNRVPTRGTGDELDRLALNLNEMLDRVQALMESLKQVSTDIAHDLRTPLSRLRQRLEGARSAAYSVEDYQRAFDEAIADTDAILGTFSALLRIAQIEAGTRRAGFSTVDLSGLFMSIAEAYGAVAEDRGQTLRTMIEPGLETRGDRELLTQMLANLIENAIRHTPAGTVITLTLAPGPSGPVGRVSDNGPGIPAAAHGKVFQRFFRLEQSRTTTGNGLGLALVAAVAEIHGIGIALADNAPGLEVQLAFVNGHPA